MNRKQKEEACGNLLAARGWLSCWFPMELGPLKDFNQDCKMNGITAGHLIGCIEKIDKTLALLGHLGGGRVA